MKVVSFHIRGKMAHFRKFYSNSSALSYFMPPRTTVCGIIAGLLGRERDTYYEEFSLEECKIAIASCKPIKKTMQKMNYLMVKSSNDLNGSQEHHSQTPMELVIPQNIRNSNIDYKIWVYHHDKNIMDQIENLFTQNKDYYMSLGACMALGSAFNLGWIGSSDIMEAEEVDELQEGIFSSSIPLDKVKEIKTDKMQEGRFRILKEEIPLEFDKDRTITKNSLKDVIINIDDNFIPAIVNSYTRLENKENIVWLE